MCAAKTNHLAQESSPYLLQHASNPVDWYPWGKEALDKAKQENKPILLSIGYAACHWCHVMAHESFENETIAELMNQLFINIKVDREERPDLDKVYQTAHYLLTQQPGGWPLTIFLTPDQQVPFFSGTYFPNEERHQLPAFRDVLRGIANFYEQKSNDIRQQNNELLALLHHPRPTATRPTITAEPLKIALRFLQQRFDNIHGGFGEAPKFPQEPKLEYLLSEHPEMAQQTLLRMAEGGIYDQLAGGFYRYTVDEAWRIPHFEKMLYDNAQLLSLYAQAIKRLRQDSLYVHVTQQTAHWIVNQMQSAQGGYFSSMDADSEGHEGKYYVWDKQELEHLLTAEEYAVVQLYYGVDQEANFENHWHFYVAQPIEFVASQLHISVENVKNYLASAKEKLLAARVQRIPAARDEKILTAWNALMIKGMLNAGYALHQPELIESAEKALHFIRKHLWVNQRLLASWKDGRTNLPAYLDDYVFLIDALLTSLQITWNTEHLKFAIQLADNLLAHFYDTNAGGFFFTANDHEALIYRPITMMDEAIPSANGIAVRVLLILGHLLGETRYIEAAEKTLESVWPALLQYPAEHCSMLLALNEYLHPSQLIVIRGQYDNITAWRDAVKTNSNYVFAIDNNEKNLPAALALKTPQAATCAYVCQGMQCLERIDDKQQLIKYEHKSKKN